jgi:elongation factor Ts
MDNSPQIDIDNLDADPIVQFRYWLNEALNSKIAKIGENMNVRRFERCEAPGVVHVGYSHGNGKIGVDGEAFKFKRRTKNQVGDH